MGKIELKADANQLMRDAEELAKFQKYFGLTLDQMLQIAGLINKFNKENNSCPYCHQQMPGSEPKAERKNE